MGLDGMGQKGKDGAALLPLVSITVRIDATNRLPTTFGL